MSFQYSICLRGNVGDIRQITIPVMSKYNYSWFPFVICFAYTYTLEKSLRWLHFHWWNWQIQRHMSNIMHCLIKNSNIFLLISIEDWLIWIKLLNVYVSEQNVAILYFEITIVHWEYYSDCSCAIYISNDVDSSSDYDIFPGLLLSILFLYQIKNHTI